MNFNQQDMSLNFQLEDKHTDSQKSLNILIQFIIRGHLVELYLGISRPNVCRLSPAAHRRLLSCHYNLEL